MYINHATQTGLAEAYAATRTANPLFNRFCELSVCQQMQIDESMQLFSCLDVATYESGTVIYEAGSVTDRTMRLIVKGSATASTPSFGHYTRMKAGDVFGLFSFLDEERPHSATVRADSDLTLLCINRDYFNLITVEDAGLGNLLLRFMFRLLSQMSLKQENEYAAIHSYVTGSHG
ncbi:MAG: cyclic nucleotide-binding domain-containing protein [Mariprofundus sp.]